MGVGVNTLLSKSWLKVFLLIRLTSAPVSALSNTEGVDREESMRVPFLLSDIGSSVIGEPNQVFVCMRNTNHVSINWLSLIIEI